MIYKPAINIIQNRIEVLNAEIKKSEQIMEEPEMVSAYIFASSDVDNFETEKRSLIGAIEVLTKR